MPAPLFRDSFDTYLTRQLEGALANVETLSERDLTSPAVQGVLEKTTNAAGFDVAVLRPEEKSGRPRTERRTNDGRTVPVEVELMDITIPFTGSPESFTVAPSQKAHIDIPVAVHQDALVATLVRDDDLERQLATFIRRIAQNLDQMRKDMGALRAGVRKAIGEAAHRRAERLKSQQEPYTIRSFPIRGD
jgi:outer membrane murein-binding lipoprotein Lpp